MDTHSADAVLQVAMQMEELGQDFYEVLASVSTDADQVRICRGSCFGGVSSWQSLWSTA
jgi:rubrerythrin